MPSYSFPASSAFQPDKPKLPPEQLQALQQLDRHPLRLPTFIGLYAIAALGLVGLQSAIGGSWIVAPWNALLGVPLYLLAAAALHGISLFTHEGVHGVLSRHPGWNRAWSMVCAWPVLQNFSAYKVLHLKHHRHLGLAGDPDHYKNYTQWSWLVFAMHWGRLLIGYPIYIVAIPILGFQQGDRGDRLWIAIELVALLGLGAIVVHFVPLPVLLHIWLIPMLCINTMVNIRGMSQHTLLEQEADVVRGTRTILTNPLTRFFMCNENYHLEHHLYPGVPWYHLPQLHAALKPELEKRGAPLIASYWAFVQEFVLASWRRSPVGTVSLGKG